MFSNIRKPSSLFLLFSCLNILAEAAIAGGDPHNNNPNSTINDPWITLLLCSPPLIATAFGTLAFLFFSPRENVSQNSAQENHSQQVQIEENKHEQQLEAVGYQGNIPVDFIDPVSRDILVDPVILVTHAGSTGHSFNKSTAEMLMESDHPVCPFSRKPIIGYVNNLILKNLIESWVNDRKEEQLKQPLVNLPRNVSKKMLLEAQSIFKNRHPKKLSQNEIQTKYSSYTV